MRAQQASRRSSEENAKKGGAAETSAAPVVYETSPEGRLALAARLWNWHPHPGQREFLTLRLEDGSEPQTLVAACGRRWGKTEALGCDLKLQVFSL